VNALEIEALTHDYGGGRRALDEVTLSVGRAEIFGLLGPNGGGKTTLFRIASTLMRPSGGAVRVLGLDTVRDAAEVRRRIGVVFQSPSLDPKLTARENLRYQGHLYGLSGEDLARRSAAMLERVGLADRAGERTENLSGGQRRRVELAKGLLHAPEVLLLDEPSTGLDPGGRRDLWTYLDTLRKSDGVTSFLTTHLMEEAERCDRLAILDGGKLVALGTPDELKARIGGDVLTLTADEELRGAITERFGVDVRVVDGKLRLELPDGHALVPKLVEAFGDRVRSISLGKPTLEDVFIDLTGHRFWNEAS